MQRKTHVNITKVIIIFILTAAFMSMLSGCSTSGKTSVKNVSVSDIWSGIKQSTDTGELIELDGVKLQRLYNLGTDEVDEFCVYISSSNVRADEIAIIKVKDAANIDSTKNKIAARVNQQMGSFKDYLPEEYSLFENHVLKSTGNYILMAVSKDAGKIENAFDNQLK